MSKKNKKQIPPQKPLPSKPRAKRSSPAWVWAIGVGLVMILLVAAVIIYGTRNADRLMTTGIRYNVSEVHANLQKQRGRFTLAEQRQLKLLLWDLDKMGSGPVDGRLMGHVNFILKVIQEMIRGGNIQPEELQKLNYLLEEAKRYQQRLRRPDSPPPQKQP